MRLSIGTNLQIEEDYTEEKETFRSRVVDYGSDAEIHIDYPINNLTNRTSFFLDGTELYVTFVDEQKISYAFRSKVIGRVKGQVPMMKISYPGDDQLIKIQRREFVRVETSVDVTLETEDGEKEQLITSDISAGGVALNIRDIDYLNVNDTVQLTLVLPFAKAGIEYGTVEAKIVRIWEDNGRNLASFQFIDIDERLRQHIVRFCFERQLEQRNERLGIL